MEGYAEAGEAGRPPVIAPDALSRLAGVASPLPPAPSSATSGNPDSEAALLEWDGLAPAPPPPPPSAATTPTPALLSKLLFASSFVLLNSALKLFANCRLNTALSSSANLATIPPEVSTLTALSRSRRSVRASKRVLVMRRRVRRTKGLEESSRREMMRFRKPDCTARREERCGEVRRSCRRRRQRQSSSQRGTERSERVRRTLCRGSRKLSKTVDLVLQNKSTSASIADGSSKHSSTRAGSSCSLR